MPVSSLPPSSYNPPPDPRLPYYGQPAAFQPHSGGPASKTMAGWSLGLAIFPSCLTWVIAVVFACIVLSRSKDGRDHGKGMSIAALIIVGVWVVIAIAVVAILAATGAQRDDSGRVTDGGRASVLDLRVGDCLPSPGEEGEKQTIDLVACEKPHRAEVFALFDLEGDYTTNKEIIHLAQAGCYDRFQAYVGISPRRSALQIYYVYPINQRTFEQDPGVSCIASSEESLTATVQGSKK